MKNISILQKTYTMLRLKDDMLKRYIEREKVKD